MGWSAAARKAAAESRRRKRLLGKAASTSPKDVADAMIKKRGSSKTVIDYKAASGPPPAAVQLHGNYPDSKNIKVKAVKDLNPGDRIVTPNGGVRDIHKVVKRRDGFIEIHTQSQESALTKRLHSKDVKFDVIPKPAGEPSKPLPSTLSTGAKRALSLMDKIIAFDEARPGHDPNIEKLQRRTFALQKLNDGDIIAAAASVDPKGYPKLLRKWAGHMDSRNTGMAKRLERLAEMHTKNWGN
jgi:hypothetical protein